ncbi:hypothetical protein NEUTE1DRAFT_150719 [Neurospora tetrasperma FGSC 2508]|uniref:AMP deaminase n=1 Tax=Neurospora tetrasperma (strain FGSC 2508 / ATCC MYA-4615 / P0657) TaxID=510951 RepID=F8N386_NEUT8|nr:uncharacterized protein NEUTE1DRAFT_150719 [Neurospora tetrasperma FGSC 2508]EGO53393.1 hypothetical protein NEUTE1DRAFT_150719 [Neurospora tetrasperma FGSC 2508]
MCGGPSPYARDTQSSSPTSPSFAASHLPARDSDDEEYNAHETSDTEFDNTIEHDHLGSRPGSAGSHGDLANNGNHSTDAEIEEGMLLRDMPKKTTFYDAVTERQMTQTDAKLFYQRSQVERNQIPTDGHATPTGSPFIAPGHGHGAGTRHIPTDSSQSAILSPESTMGTGLKAGPANDPLIEASLRQKMPRLSGSYSHTRTVTGSSPLPGRMNQAAQRETLLNTGMVSGIGSSTYMDTDPQITAELTGIFQGVQKIIDLRQKYINLSLQGPHDNPKDDPSWVIYPPPPGPAWSAGNSLANSMILNNDKHEGSSGTPYKWTGKRRKPGQDIGEDFVLEDLLPVPGSDDFTYKLDENGVYQIYSNDQDKEADQPAIKIPTLREYYLDLEAILFVSSDGPSKSFAFRRLQYLEKRFDLYVLLEGYDETADCKKVPHRDFYNVRKVDTHVHHSACMNQKHLLRFIKSKIKKYPDEIVLYRDGKYLTLAEVFESLNLTAYDLSIDTLDMHAHTDSFHRFDKFNLKYNPIGESRLRTIFLKTDNFINGRYLAEITKEVIADLESSKYQMVEWRVSIYGKSLDEWDKLASWVVDNKLFSHNVRWLVQIPRLYDVYKASGGVNTFEEIVRNIFEPLFEVTKDPSSHPKLHIFLQRVIGLDSVDDESKVERRLFRKFPVPKIWDGKQNPPYSYWIYYLYANMASLNHWRKRRGFNTFVLRPHCGEAGDSEHLAVAALCCHSISHGLLLRKVPVLQYVFYLEKIGIAMSPLSNNALFLAYERNPMHQYFKRGLNVSLSTDDPLQFAFTKEPLIEEYAVAAQIYKLSPVDMCELAKNSVKQSGYERSIKEQWLGKNFDLPGAQGNTMVKTNVPDRREEFRYRTLLEERGMVERYNALAAESAAAVAQAAPKSPAPPAKASIGEAKTLLNTSTLQPAPHGGTDSLSQSQTLPSPMQQSPQLGLPSAALEGTGTATGLTDSMRELHLPEHEPRYFPGVMSRSQGRKTSTRQSSLHESDAKP